MIKVENYEIKPGMFPDHTLALKMPFCQYDLEALVTKKYIDIDWHFEDDKELFLLICIKDYLDEWLPECKVSLTMAYLPHARMDRVKDCQDVFTLKSFCKIINNINFDMVYIKDPHSNVSTALLDRAVVQSIKPEINNVIRKILTANIELTATAYLNRGNTLIAFYPDEGAMKRYSETTELPYAFGIKKRDWKTGEIQGLDIMNKELVKDKTVLIIDDICSRGGTFYHSAKALHEAGAANIYLYITHCENTIHEGELLKEDSLIKHIFTTDSLLTKPHEKITII